MAKLTVVQIDPNYLANFGSWFDDFSSTDVLFKQEEFLKWTDRAVKAWVGTEKQEMVAVAFFSMDVSRHGHIFFAVKPSERRKGIGAEMMRYVLTEPLVNNLLSTHVTIRPDNIAGQKVLRKTGFSQTGFDPEGNLEYERL